MLARPPLSLAMAPLRSPLPGREPRALIEWAAAAGFRWITLDGASRGLRGRELDRSGRRDLAALLRRLELGFCGIDLWIPSAHLTDPEHADRALGGVLDALGLAADINALSGGIPVVSLTMPPELAVAARDSIIARADSCGVRLADHAWPPAEGPVVDCMGVGVDPAALLLAGDNPAKAVARLGSRLAAARLSDASDIGRVEPGGSGGRLNDLAYTVALETAKHTGPVILDLRGLADPLAAAPRALHWWSGS